MLGHLVGTRRSHSMVTASTAAFMVLYRLTCRANKYVFFGSAPDKKLSYKAHYMMVTALLAKCGVISSKATHLFRGASARELHAMG
jgi:hypothetical protein